jgi:hypothetical protein
MLVHVHSLLSHVHFETRPWLARPDASLACAAQMEMEDCAGMSTKIEQIVHRCKYLERAMEAIADKLWEPEVPRPTVVDCLHVMASG